MLYTVLRSTHLDGNKFIPTNFRSWSLHASEWEASWTKAWTLTLATVDYLLASSYTQQLLLMETVQLFARDPIDQISAEHVLITTTIMSGSILWPELWIFWARKRGQYSTDQEIYSNRWNALQGKTPGKENYAGRLMKVRLIKVCFGLSLTMIISLMAPLFKEAITLTCKLSTKILIWVYNCPKLPHFNR